jgi:hypothetical protein
MQASEKVEFRQPQKTKFSACMRITTSSQSALTMKEMNPIRELSIYCWSTHYEFFR